MGYRVNGGVRYPERDVREHGFAQNTPVGDCAACEPISANALLSTEIAALVRQE